MGKKKNRSQAFAENPRRNLPTDARSLIADVSNDITVPYFSGVLSPVDDTLIQQGNGKGLKIYDEIERDTHAGSMLQKRKGRLIARAWEVQPGGDRPIDKEAADFCEQRLRKLPFDQATEDMLDATLKGFSVLETVWDRDGKNIVPVALKDIDQRRIVFGRDWRPRLLTWTAITEGIELPERKFMVHRVGVKGNNPYGLGLGSSLFWPVLFKREGIAFWLHFLEKFAGPTVVGKTPYGTLSDEQGKLLQTLQRAQTASAITVPIGTDVEFLEASRSGSVTYEQFLEYWDRQISIAVTGETLTTQAGSAGGNRALGEVHQEELDTRADRDGDLLSGTLKRDLLTWMVEYNFPGAAVPDVWRVRPKNEKAEAETRKTKAEAAESGAKALRTIVTEAAKFEDDAVAREYIVSFAITDHLSDRTIDAMVAARADFAGGGGTEEPDIFPGGDPAAFSASRLKKKR
ncbi:DUF935 family protein [Sinirhodobacter populi]|uniref:DUF935 family protein n=1 Tax=Paenirhodobacter populi TaxID=2306993 RepID=A0A443K7I3_9RHOB|nr:DUF935 family protein [Sinirhodobacter populi]RWR28714.1 DUF935 family protein [Sinirhodobacter populi]